MITIEYGQTNDPVVLLLHGGGLSWWNYRAVAERLQDRYHVILPVLDGHAGSERDFTTIKDQAKELIRFLDEKYQGSAALIGGLSLGGQIVVEMLAHRPDICRYALIESALIQPMKWTRRLVKPMLDMSFGLIRQKWFARLQFKALRLPDELFADYYRDTCQLTKANMMAFLKANAGYTPAESLADTQAEVCIAVGGREAKQMIRSARELNRRLPGSTLIIWKRLYHGEFSIKTPAAYAQQIVDRIG